jgi:hypothetical protein
MAGATERGATDSALVPTVERAQNTTATVLKRGAHEARDVRSE